MLRCSDQIKSLAVSKKCLQITEQDHINQRNGHFNPSQKINDPIEVKNLSTINSFSINNIVLHFEKEEINHCFSLMSENSHDFYNEESSNNLLQMNNGYFSSYYRELDKQMTLSINNWTLPMNNGDKKTISTIGQAQIFSNKYLSYQSSKFMEQEFQSKDKESSDNNKSLKNTKISISTRVQSTKNVTKNMGKLLLKFIWKNRKHLQHQMQVSNQKWQSFIKQIRQWKGENNITRQYLLVRWKGLSENNILFRIISRHFFRKRCISTLYSSNIRGKKLHLQRIQKFDHAITNPESLDYIN